VLDPLRPIPRHSQAHIVANNDSGSVCRTVDTRSNGATTDPHTRWGEFEADGDWQRLWADDVRASLKVRLPYTNLAEHCCQGTGPEAQVADAHEGVGKQVQGVGKRTVINAPRNQLRDWIAAKRPHTLRCLSYVSSNSVTGMPTSSARRHFQSRLLHNHAARHRGCEPAGTHRLNSRFDWLK
jgi:hypothetical protein